MKKMKPLILLACAACGATFLVTACNKQDENQPPPAASPQKANNAAVDAQQAVADVTAQAQKQADGAKPAVDAALAMAQQPTNAAVSSGSTEVQGLMDKAKALVAEKKYTEALGTVGDLSKLKLTSEQQKWVDELKAQIQKAMTTQASPAGGVKMPGAQ